MCFPNHYKADAEVVTHQLLGEKDNRSSCSCTVATQLMASILHLRKWEVGIQATVILACAEAGIARDIFQNNLHTSTEYGMVEGGDRDPVGVENSAAHTQVLRLLSHLHLVHGQDREASGVLCPTVAEAEESAFRQVGVPFRICFEKLALMQHTATGLVQNGPEFGNLLHQAAQATHQPMRLIQPLLGKP